MKTFRIPHSHGKQPPLSAVHDTLNDARPFEKAALLFRCLSDDVRIRIFWLLCHREECVVNMAALLQLSSPAVAHHLRSLREMGLISCRRMGKEVHYRAADTEVCRLLHRMAEQVMALSCPREADPTNQELIRQVHDYLLEHLQEKCTIEDLAARFHMSPTTLKQQFSKTYGTSVAGHTRHHRLEEAAWLLQTTDLSVADVARQVGYTSQSRFTDAFRQQYGRLPTAFRKEK